MEVFKTMAEMMRPPMLAYCDYVADLIKRSLITMDQRDQHLLSDIGKVKYDLDSYGALISTKKTIEVTDRYGKKYRVTVEEV